jgi:hypothetical protein
LFAVVCPLHRVVDHDERTPGGEAASEVGDRVATDAGDLRRPGGVLPDAVDLTEQVGGEAVEPGAAPAQEVLVVPPVDQHRVGDAEHRGGVGVGDDGQPLGVEEVGGVAADGADVHEPHPGVTAPALQVPRLVPGQPSRVDLAVLEG